MIFAAREFFVFLPIVLLGYHLLQGRRWKYLFLLIASWLFYAKLSPGYLWVILTLTVIDYFVGLRIEASDDDRVRKRWLMLSVISNLALLAAFKYTTFFFDNALEIGRWFGVSAADRHWDILLPLGISFHTFQGISYTVDVYRRQIRAVRSPLDYALFVAFFPQLAAGPIVRAVEFLPQMERVPHVGAKQVAEGLHRFLLGLVKKLLIADQLHVLIVDPVFSNPDAFGAGMHRWAALAWAVQIYCDFSGYTDMAIGVAKWFGFDLPANFDLPYLATNITDFWRRWHMSLSTWLRDYLYFPLGGSRGGPVRTYANLMLVFVLCGLWHGAAWHWFVYGVYNGVLMCLHRAFDRGFAEANWRRSWWWLAVARAATLYQLLFGLVLIRMADWSSGGRIILSLLGVESDVAGGTVPLFVPVLVLLGLLGHMGRVSGFFSDFSVNLSERWTQAPHVIPRGACAPRSEEEADVVRGLGYAVAAVLLVTLSPGVGKSFIYIAF